MCGFWTKPGLLAEPVHDDPAHIRNLVKLGDIVVYESTLIVNDGTSQDEWVKAANRKLDNPGNFFACIDVASARRNGARPLPLRNAGEVAEIDLDRVKAADLSQTHLDAVATADREAGVAGTGTGSDLPSRRVAEWQMKLLDLTLHNRLINLKQTSKTLQLNVPDLAAFEDGLWNEARFSIKPQATLDEESLRTRLDDGVIHTRQSAAETSNALLTLYREHRVAIEESGANPLFVTLGQLKWYESDASEQPRFAPLLLLPVQLVRHGDGGGYRYELQMTDEPVRVNVTLLEKLRMEFGLDVTPLGVIPEDENGVDVHLLLRRAREVIRGMKRWEVVDTATLGMFSFSKFLMWRDLQEHLETLRKNRLVNHLLEKPGQDLPNPPFANAETLDDDIPAEDLFCTRDADSSQLAAVRSASQGVSFVLEGPPGTGKSQTIANIVADSIARGKRVLFVAEKMAALTVVRDRLEKDGLGAFCLELHSAKASKREVIAQLERAMGARSAPITDRWKSACNALTNERNALNAYVRELHKPRASGETLHQVLGRLSRLGDGPAAAPHLPDPSATSEATLTAMRALVQEVATMAAPVDPVREHPLREVTRRTSSMTLRDEVRTATENAALTLNNLRASLEGLYSAIGATVSLADVSRRCVVMLASCAELVDASTPMPLALTSAPNASSSIEDCRSFVALGREVDTERDRLSRVYRDELLDSDVLQLLDQVRTASTKRGLFSFFARQAAKKRLRPLCRDRTPELQEAATDLESIATMRRKAATLATYNNARTCLSLGASKPSWGELDRIIDKGSRMQALMAAHAHDEYAVRLLGSLTHASADSSRRTALVDAMARFSKALSAWTEAWNRLDALLGVAACETEDLASGSPWFSTVAGRISRWQSGVNSLRDWCAWQDVRARALDAGLAPLIAVHEQGAARNVLSDAFERGYGRLWFNSVADRIPAIRDFTEQAHSARIRRFREHDQQVTSLTPLAVAGRVTSEWPDASVDAAAQSELGVLRRELQKKTRLLPTRRLIESAPNLIARLKPCFLMSPLSVAQYLDAKLPPFDLVVFDEASQIPVWDAIGALARGKDAIVVGDSKQLPPTNFFNVSTSSDDDVADEEDDATEEMESILKKCLASGVPSMWLKWHYRSKHESLIAFSNHHYYENRLNTFPSPTDRSSALGVTFRHIPEGVYDRGGSRTNRIEAQQVVDEVVRQLTNATGPSSIGIVTFNQAQQSLIEDLLDAKRREMPDLERHFTQEREPVFVKNLENVQGDERDTIIFSVGYGKDATGKCSLNFGPVNQSGGERRLNVAVTRARRSLIVFSGITADDLDPRRIRSTGLQHFRRYLDYARRGPRAIAEALTASRDDRFDSGFEQAVCAALRSRGWQVDTQVGCAGYRVDLGVKHPQKPGHYVLGIECDGAAYHSAKTARDRDRLRESVLKSLGWNICRVWSTDWWEAPDRCIERLNTAIQQAIAQHETAVEVPLIAPPPSPAVEKPQERQFQSASASTETARVPSGLLIYRAAASPSSRTLDVYRDGSEAVNCLRHLLEHEGPIVDELIVQRLASWSDLQRVTEKFRGRVAEITQYAIDQGMARRFEDAVALSTSTTGPWPVRAPGPHEDDTRSVGEIPLVELASAAVHVVRTQFGLPLDAVATEVGSVLGQRRVSANDRTRLMHALRIACDQGALRVSADRVIPAS
ncbi:MAG: DUF4011 domain-containing protein [Phycisphaerae bacterium]